MDKVSYFAVYGPPALYRVVEDEDGIVGYAATPVDPEWRGSAGVVPATRLPGEYRPVELTREQALVILKLWGGKQDAFDQSAPPATTLPPAEDTGERINAFRALRDVAGPGAARSGELILLRPKKEEAPYSPGEPGDYRKDREPSERPLFP